MVSGLYQAVPAIMSGRGASLVPRNVAREWLVASMSSVLRPAGFLMRPRGRQHRRPVVLVHGYGMGRSNFMLLARRLLRAGRGPVIPFDYWSLGPIGNSSDDLSRFLEDQCAKLGCPHLDIVGHSLGGVVARHALTIGGSSRIGTLITLGSPHSGTDTSWLGLGRASREMLPGSRIRCRSSSLSKVAMRALGRFNPRTPTLCFVPYKAL